MINQLAETYYTNLQSVLYYAKEEGEDCTLFNELQKHDSSLMIKLKKNINYHATMAKTEKQLSKNMFNLFSTTSICPTETDIWFLTELLNYHLIPDHFGLIDNGMGIWEIEPR